MRSELIKVFVVLSVFLSACSNVPKRLSRSHKSEFVQLKKKISQLEDENAILKSREKTKYQEPGRADSSTSSNSAMTTRSLAELRTQIENDYEQKRYGEVLSATFSLTASEPLNREMQIQVYSIRFIRAMSLQKIGLNEQAEEIFRDLASLKFPSISKLAEEQLRNSVFLKRKVSKTGASSR